MTQLTYESPRPFVPGNISAGPMKAGVKIYEGSAVGIEVATGYARQLEAGDTFLGFAVRTVDNAGGADGALDIKVESEGNVILTVASLAITDVGAEVYASDGNTFTKTATSNTRIGYVRRVDDDSANTAEVTYSNAFSAIGT